MTVLRETETETESVPTLIRKSEPLFRTISEPKQMARFWFGFILFQYLSVFLTFEPKQGCSLFTDAKPMPIPQQIYKREKDCELLNIW